MIKYVKHIVQRRANKWGFEIKQLYPRPAIKFIKDHFNNLWLKGAEVGVLRGENAFSILRELDMLKLYLIDPWKEFDDYKQTPVDEQVIDLTEAFKETKDCLFFFRYQYKIIRKTSIEGAKLVPNKLDFVYLDANHDYEYVKQDLEIWYEKLRIGGVLAGHDFENGYGKHAFHNDVCRAVIEFAVENNLKLYNVAPDWWIVKGEENV